MDPVLIKDFFEEENTHWWHVAKRRMIKSFLPIAHGRVLVIGLGGGLLCAELSKTHEVIAIDISSIACAHANKTYGLNTIVCDLKDGLPFRDAQFDLIIMADVMEHIDDDAELLTQIKRCLVLGGFLLLTVPAYQHMWSYWDERLHHFRRYEYKALRNLIKNQGFSINRISFFNAIIYPAAYLRRKLIKNMDHNVSDFKISQGGKIINAIMAAYYLLERGWSHVGSIPFGLSLFVLAQKK